MSKENFFEPEINLVNEICQTNSPKLLEELFTRRVQRWPHPYMHVELATIGTFSDLLNRLSPPAAFDLIPHAVNLLLGQTKPELVTVALSLLDGLAGASKTTQLPVELDANWQRIETFLSSLPQDKERELYWNEFCRWYRRM